MNCSASRQKNNSDSLPIKAEYRCYTTNRPKGAVAKSIIAHSFRAVKHFECRKDIMIELRFIQERAKHDVLSEKVFALFQQTKVGDVNE